MAKPGKLAELKILKNWLMYMYRSEMFNRYIYAGKKKRIPPQNPQAFRSILQRYDRETVFVHAGLKAVKEAFPANDPYEFLISELEQKFESILAPGFTPSFRRTGIYHKQFSLPEYGSFSRLFLKDSNYRTNDAIHSILVRGDYSFDDVKPQDSFGKHSCFSQLDRDNVLILNVGTNWLVSAQLHYIENLLQVPYMETARFPGVLYYDEKQFSSIVQLNFRYRKKVQWNRAKLKRDMLREGVLEHYDLGGLPVSCFRARNVREFLAAKLAKDPYYLVK